MASLFFVPAAAESAESPITIPPERTNPEVVATVLWTQCLSKGRQVLLDPDGWRCTDRQDGENLLTNLEPEKFDPAFACLEGDKRRMPTGLLQRLAAMVKANMEAPNDSNRDIQKNGIRIIGAAFCRDEVNLTGFRLDVPLVLDRSVLKFGFRARDMTIAGNLSFAGSYVYDNFDISDSNIAGTLFGRGSFMQRVRLTDTKVRDVVRFNNSVLLGYVLLSKVTARLVDVSGSKLSSLTIQQSPIAERLDLSNSEAMCKYLIEKSEVNEILATDAGFGKTIAQAPTVKSAWNRPFPIGEASSPTKRMLEVKTVKAIYDAPTTCDDTKLVFRITDGSARSVCLRHFHWPAPPPDKIPAPAHISFTRVGGIEVMNVNLWPSSASDPDTAIITKRSRVLEIVGLSIGTLLYDFNDNDRRYNTNIEQISLNRVQAAQSDCRSYRDLTSWPSPRPRQVADWLRKNNTKSLQPYAAFVKAFENAADDATDLKVAKARFEFDESYAAYNEALDQGWQNAKASGSVAQFLWQDGWHVPLDYLAFGTKWLLGKIADFGFRPAQVFWTVLGIVALSWIIFWLPIRIVAFQMAKKPEMRIVGLAFLFDRLLPVYKLRDDHYDVGLFYQRGTGPEEKTIRYFGRTITCVPASLGRMRIAELYLDFLKLLGIVLAAFLVAAVNALIAR